MGGIDSEKILNVSIVGSVLYFDSYIKDN